MTESGGERRPRGELEGNVLTALWAAGRPLSAAQVRAAMPSPLARTTVATLLVRLYTKGMLRRSPADRGFLYFPVADSHGLTAQRMHHELDQDEDRSLALARFIETLGPDDEKELRRLLEGGGQ
ncbi:BlaI/MecI/CopY family transcriptional regulator [Streptomyces sp. NPDC102487]|uniref:BlaI/MecI/CopY family transcriptional regulator n=1 Tax=Streptomyces sp. NPDC102487 TaxID=3366182 RepID=UPI00381B105C